MKDKLLLFCLIIISFYSCKKESIVIDPTYENVVNSLSLYDSLPINKGDTVLIDVQVKFDYYDYASLPAILEGVAKSDGKLTARIDTNQLYLNVYDDLYNTKSPRIIDGMFKLSNDGILRVKQGIDRTTDSITVKIDDVSKFSAIGNMLYIIPIVIESQDESLKVKSKVVFVRYKVWQTTLINTNVENDVFGHMNTFTSITFSAVRKRFAYNQSMNFEFEIDESAGALENYNKNNRSHYLDLPSEILTINNSLTFSSTSTIPTQYPSVKIDNSTLDKSKDYIKILKIKSLNGQSVSSNFRMYFLYFWNRIDPANTKLVGTKLDKSSWTATASSSFIADPPWNIFDENNTTIWRSSGTPSPPWIIIDMKKVNSIKGFEITPNYYSRSSDIRVANISGSLDGVKWEFLGRYTGTATLSSSSATNPDYKYINFLVPQSYRYYRFNITSTSFVSGTTIYTGMAEIDAYQ